VIDSEKNSRTWSHMVATTSVIRTRLAVVV
jgi:hypothetical protein